MAICAFAPGSLWLIPHGIGSSIAAASGISNTGIAVIVFFPIPFLYVVVSSVCVNIARYRLKSARPDTDSAAQYA